MTGRTKGMLARSAGLVVLSGALIAAGPAFGQGATDQTTTSQNSASTETLQEVVVTAEKRAENIQTTPISVIAVSGNDLKAASVTSISNLASVAPGLTVQNSGGSGSVLVNIRGIGVTPIGADALAGVTMVRDGVVNNTTGFGMNMPFYDMADVEVLRGPQGTFQGDSSTGGAIIINSQDPNFRGINGYVTAKVATYSDTGLEGAINLPVTDTLAMRLAFNEEQRGSYSYDLGSALYGPSEGGPFLINRNSPSCPGNIASEPPPAPVASPGTTLFNQPLNFCGTSAATRKTGEDPGNLNNKDIRLGLLWRPSDNFQSLTKIEIDNQNTDGLPYQPTLNTFAPLAPGEPCPANHGTAPNCTALYITGYSGSPRVLNYSVPTKFDEAISMYSEQLQYTFSGGTVAKLLLADTEIGDDTLASNTDDSINLQTPNSATYPITQNENTSTFKEHGYNVEIDFISPTTGKLSWIAGANWTYTANQFGSFSPSTDPTSGYSPNDLGVTQWVDGETIYAKDEGIFGQLSYQVVPTLQFQIGAHVGWDVDTGFGALQIGLGSQPNGQPIVLPSKTNPNGENLGPLILLALGAYNHGQVLAGDNAVLTGKVGFNWQPVQDQFFYVFWARGYKPGLGNLGLVPPTTKEEDNDTELGWKGTFAHGHLITQLGGYYINYYNFQESIFNPYNVAGTSDANIPYSSISGLEASLQTQVGGFGADLSASLNRSVLGHTVTAATYAFPAPARTNQCTATTGPPVNTGTSPLPPGYGTNCTDYTGAFTGESFMRTLSGESLPYSPRFQANATLKYLFRVSDGMSLQPRLQYSYVGVEYASLFQINYYKLHSHGLLNTYLDWNAGPWTTTLYATNVSDKLYETNLGPEVFGAPRVLGLQFTRTF
jgi:iron complex outermembrane recepter protein